MADLFSGELAQSNPSVFTFGANAVRVVMRDDEPWFVATDVASALGYSSPKDAAEHLDVDEKGSATTRTPGGEQKVTVINESGLYALVLRSRKPEARKFAKWVTGEVLPAIRKTGGYAKPAAEADRTRAAFDAATQAAAFVQNAVFNAVMSGGDDWKDDRWMITFREDVAKNLLAYVHPMEVGAIAAPWPRLVKDVEGGECLRSNSDLIEMASACMQRLQRRAGQARIAA